MQIGFLDRCRVIAVKVINASASLPLPMGLHACQTGFRYDQHHSTAELLPKMEHGRKRRLRPCVGGNIVHHVPTHDDPIEYLMAGVAIAGADVVRG